MGFSFQKAKREKAKARICLSGTSGSGKTLSALYLAYGMTGDWSKVAVIDSERGRALMYADRSDLGTEEYLHCDLEPPYSVDRYVEAMRMAEEIVGEDGVIVIDSASHAWFGQGGVLDAKEAIAQQRGKTEFSAWGDAGKIQNRFVDTIMDLKCHVIMTLRSKTEYSQERDEETGKTRIKKLGLKPIQKDDMEYEMTIAFDIDKDTHFATITKDNTFLDSEGFYGVITPELGSRIAEWLNNGKEPEILTCECCGKRIKIAQIGDQTMSAKQVAENAEKKFGKKMCIDCVVAENKKAKEQQEQENNVEE